MQQPRFPKKAPCVEIEEFMLIACFTNKWCSLLFSVLFYQCESRYWHPTFLLQVGYYAYTFTPGQRSTTVHYPIFLENWWKNHTLKSSNIVKFSNESYGAPVGATRKLNISINSCCSLVSFSPFLGNYTHFGAKKIFLWFFLMESDWFKDFQATQTFHKNLRICQNLITQYVSKHKWHCFDLHFECNYTLHTRHAPKATNIDRYTEYLARDARFS